MGAFRSLVANIAAQPKNIEFVDAAVKDICVTNWDTNGDGELSYSEAKSVTSLLTYFRGKTNIKHFDEFVYFDNVTSLGNTFLNCYYLESITLPKGLKTIGQSAFEECIKVVIKEIPDSVTAMGQFAFFNCQYVEFSKLPPNIKTLTKQVFYNCKRITISEIPEGVTYIVDNAFGNCTKIPYLILPTKPPTLTSKNAFSGTTFKLKCKTQESLDAYLAANVWSGLSSRLELA